MRLGFPLLAFVVLLGALFFPRFLDAAPSSRLVYGRPGEICPDESELRAAVRSRLGYDPFFPWAAQTIVVHVAQRANRRLSGKVYLVDNSGRASPEREFTTSAGECDELMQTLALAIVITLDPLHGTTASAAPNTSNAPASTAKGSGDVGAPSIESTASDAVGSSLVSKKEAGDAAPAGESRSGSPKTTAAVLPDAGEARRPDVAEHASSAGGRSRPIHLELGVGMLGAVRTMPGISVGAAPFVRFRRSPYSFGLEGRIERLAWSDDNGDRATVGLMGGTVVPCYHLSNITLCWAVLVGRYTAEGVEAAARSASAPFVATGARVGAEIPLSTGVWAFLRAEALANMSRHQLTLGGTTFWQVPMWSLTLSAGAVASIF